MVRFFTLLFILALATVGCVNLDAIVKFSAAGKQAQERFPMLVADLQASCARRVDYNQLENRNTDQQSFSEGEQEECGKYAKYQPVLLAAGNTFFAYLNALGALAANRHSNLPSGLAEVVDNSSKFNLEQKKAFKGLYQFVSDALTQGYRQSRLAKAIKARNNDVQIAVAALNSILVSDYEVLLRDERQEMRSYYLTNIKECADRNPLAVILVEHQWREDRETLARRQAGAEAFGKMLRKIALIHDQLASNATEIDSQAVLKSALQGAAQIAQLAGEFAAGYPSGR